MRHWHPHVRPSAAWSSDDPHPYRNNCDWSVLSCAIKSRHSWHGTSLVAAMITSRPDKVCLTPGCGAIGPWVGGYCPAHKSRGSGGQALRPLEKLYHQALYKNSFQRRMKGLNPICQRIEDGKQCKSVSTELHHLVEPQTSVQFFDPYNCCMLCAHHHPGGQPGTNWAVGVDYVPTVWRAPSFG